MTGNRTTERLMAMLEERGVKWKTKSYPSTLLSSERLTDTYWQAGNAEWRFTERPDGCTYLSLIGIWADCTPEQAIVATLESDGEYEAKMDALLCRLTNGKWSKSRAYSLDFMVSCVDEEYEYAYEKEHAELWSGTLTAEQVKRIHEIIEKHWHDLPHEYDMPEATALPEYSYDWQAIAAELNAELGSGTCKNIAPEYLDFLCSECGFVHYHSDENDSGDGNDWAFFPRCGKRIER